MKMYVFFTRDTGKLLDFYSRDEPIDLELEQEAKENNFSFREVTMEQARAIKQWNDLECPAFHGDYEFEEDLGDFFQESWT